MGIISSKICRMYPIVVCKREFYINLLVINTQGFDMILGMDWLKNFHAVKNNWKISVFFIEPNHSQLDFIRDNNKIEPIEFRTYHTDGVLACLDATLVEIPTASEFMDIFENFKELPPDRIVELL